MLDEMFEAITLNSDPQDQELPNCDHGTDYCDQIIRFIDKMAKAGMSRRRTWSWFTRPIQSITLLRIYVATQSSRFGLPAARRVRPHWRWLGEAGLPPRLIALSNLRPPGRRT